MSNVQKIKELAKERGIRMGYIYEKIGCSRSKFSDVESGKSSISEREYAIIAAILNTTPEYLNGETDQKEKPAGESTDGLSDYEVRMLAWFRSLPPEKRKAILEIGDGPKE